MKLPVQSPPVQRNLLVSESYLKDGGLEAAQNPLASLPGFIDHLFNDINSIFTRVTLQTGTTLPFGLAHLPVVPTGNIATPAVPICCCTRQTC